MNTTGRSRANVMRIASESGGPLHSAKSAAITAVERLPQQHGGALLPGGARGNKGGTGRPSNLLREWCDVLLASGTTRKHVEAILANKDHPHFVQMWKALADRAYGKPHPPIDLDGPDGGGLTITFAFGREGRRFDTTEVSP